MNSSDLRGRDVLSANARVQRFRDRLRAEEGGRLDVWIGKGWIHGLRVIAQHQKRPLWDLVQEAVKDYVARNARVITPPRDRNR